MFRLSMAFALFAALLPAPGSGSSGDEPLPLLRALRDVRRGVQALDVSPEQRLQIRDVLRARKQELLAATERAHAARRLVLDAEAQDSVDSSLIRERVQAAAAAASDVAVLRAQLRHDVRAVLTPSQRTGADRIRGRFMATLERLRLALRSLFEESI